MPNTVIATHDPVAPRMTRRDCQLAAYRAARRQLLALARRDARARVKRYGERAAIVDARLALAHPAAARWQPQREALEEAIRGGEIPAIGAAAREASFRAAGDAARTGKRAPDRDIALAVATAYQVIAAAPWAARPQRSRALAARYPETAAATRSPAGDRGFWQ
jgi:hypothetical protein